MVTGLLARLCEWWAVEDPEARTAATGRRRRRIPGLRTVTDKVGFPVLCILSDTSDATVE